MALNTKYTLTFDVLETPARVLATYVVYFKKEGYAGGITAFTDAEKNGLRSKITNSNDSIIGINEKKIEIGILTAIDVSELQTTKPKEWKIEITKTVGSTITSDFEGWLIPTNNATDYEDGLKYVRLEATDGLNFLKNVDFVNDSSVYYDGVISIFEILRLTLLKTGLSLKINTINNTFGVNDNKADTDEALKQRFVDINLLRGDNEPFDSYKVLGDVVKTEKCRVYQEDGQWWIENIAEKKNGFVKSRKYNADGSFVSGGTLNIGVEAVHNSNYQPLDGGGLSNTMPIKWAKVEHKLARFKNRLMNKDFANFVDGSFTNWFKSNAELNISRDGNGTSENLFGVKIIGFATKTSVARSLYHSIDLAVGRTAALKAIERNITFSGKAYTRDVKSALVKLILIIETSNSGFGYFGLSDTGEWIKKTTDIGLDNVDINGYSKKAPVSWDIISKKISDIIFYSSATNKMVDWIAQVTKVSVVVHLCEGIVQIDPFPGETQSSSVIYKNINLGWVDADTNRNLKQINYKATQVDYAPNNETFEAIYGDYVDGSNLSTIKDGSGNVTTSWVSASSNTPKNFHAHGVNDILDELGKTPKVYDGTIWGLLKYRHSVGLTGVTNRGYIVSYGFNYGNTQCDVRVVEHSNVLNKSVKKIGVLSDGTEIEMVLDSTPVTYSGNSTASTPSFFNFSSWLQQLLSGFKAVAPNDEIINIVWDNLSTDDTHDFGAVVRRSDKLVIGEAYVDGITLGNKINLTLVEVLGGKIKIGDNLLYDKSIIDGDGDIVKQLGVDSDLQVDGRIEAVSGISVGSDGILITKQLGAGGKAFGQVDAQNELRFISPVVNVTNILGVNQITGINGAGVAVNAPFTFNQPIYVQASNNPNSPITNAQFNTVLAGGFAVSTTCKLLFNTNQSLAEAKTQGGYTTVTGDSILLNGQTTASENGIYVLDGTNWIRNTANDTSAEIRGKGHLILNGTNASTQWVNNNSTDIILGTTAITYTQWSGAELDPIFTNHAAFNVTNAKIASWDLASTYGNHAGLYVDLVSNQKDIGGPKTFTASVQSPIIKAGSNSVNIQISNYSGNTPRIASNANTLDFFTVTNFTWTTVGDLGRMKLNATGLRVGSSTDPLFKLHVSGTTGFEGLISVGNTSQNIAMSSGTAGQFLRRSNVSNGFYNVDVNRWENFGEFGQFQTHEQFGNITALPFGASFVNGTTTNLPNGGLQAHVVKMSIGSEYPDQATYLAIPRPFANYFDGQIYVRGIYGGADSGWISVGGNSFKDYDFDEGEATIKYHGYFYNNTPEGREGFIGFNRLDGGVVLEYKYTAIDSTVTTTYRNIMNSDGRLAYQIGSGEAKKYALLEEVGTGGAGTTYTPSEPIYFVGNNINVRTASASQNGVLTKEDWVIFNGKQNTLAKASAMQDGYLSKEDWSLFNAANTWSGGYVTSDIQLGTDVDLLWGNILPPTLLNYGARIAWKSDTPQLNTYNFGSGVRGMLIETTYTGDGMYIGTQGDMKLQAFRYFIENKEIDMRGFATGKVLKATSATKAEWVTP